MNGSSMVERREVVAAAVETGYLVGGPEDAPVLVLVHGAGIGMGAHSWFPAADLLLDRFRVVAPDLLGYGTTRKVVYFDRSAGAQRLDHVAAFCAALGIDEAGFVGHSMGGGLVLAGGISGRLPATHLVSIAGPGGILLDRKRMAAGQTDEPDLAWARAACEVGVPEPTEASVDARLRHASDPEHLAAMGVQGALNRLHPRGADYESRYLAQLAQVQQPTLLVAGSDDPFADISWADVLAGALPNAAVLMVNGARHEPHGSHPDLVMTAVAEHCARPAVVP